MSMVKLLHAADLHLDSAFSALPPEKAAQRRAEQRLVQAPGSNGALRFESTVSISPGFSVVNDRRSAHRPKRRRSSRLSRRYSFLPLSTTLRQVPQSRTMRNSSPLRSMSFTGPAPQEHSPVRLRMRQFSVSMSGRRP